MAKKSKLKTSAAPKPEEAKTKAAPKVEKPKGPSVAAISDACKTLCAMALGNQGYTLYPKPKAMGADVYNAAIEKLVADGLAHGGTNPNLTKAGVEKALEG